MFVEHIATASLYRVNDDCLTSFPDAADVVGRVPVVGGDPLAAAPWRT